jgi:hypothetical protein
MRDILYLITRLLCRHEDLLVFGKGADKDTIYLRCMKCDRRTTGWDMLPKADSIPESRTV